MSGNSTEPDHITLEELIISLVEPERVLWDAGEPNYHRNDVKNQKWNEVCDKLAIEEITVDMLKKKWKSIVTSYRNSKKKRPSGSAAGRKKKYRSDLSFLDSGFVSENADNRTSSLSLGSNLTREGDEESFGAIPEADTNQNDESNRPESRTSNRSISRPSTSSRPNSSTQETHDFEESIDKLLHTVEQTWTNIAKENEQTDSVSLFCDSLKDRLRSLDPVKLMLCEADILQVIAKHLTDENL